MSAGGDISIVVPTRDRPADLARCLTALAGQDAPIEVVVVDDGSRDRAAVAEALAPLEGARLVRTPGRGPATARNAGLRAADGEVVCFTDDDCAPEPAWARLLAAAAAEHGAAGGRTVVPAGAPPPVAAAQAIIDGLQLASLDPATASLGFVPSCNLAVLRERALALPFSESFPGAGGEDREWSTRAVAAGLRPRYEPDAVVVHRPRLDAAGFLRQQLRYGRGAARFRRASGERPASPRFYADLVRRGFSRGTAAGGLVLAAQAATAAGVAAERLARLRRRSE